MAASTKKRELILLLFRFGIAGLFLYAGILKILDPEQLATDIESYHLVPEIVVPYFARFLPCLEMLCGLALLLRKFYFGALTVLSGLTAIFIGALAISWARGLDISCGCFGGHSGEAQYDWWITRDLVLLAVLGYLLWIEYTKQGPNCAGNNSGAALSQTVRVG